MKLIPYYLGAVVLLFTGGLIISCGVYNPLVTQANPFLAAGTVLLTLSWAKEWENKK